MPTEDAGYELVTRIRLGDDTYSEEESIDDLNTMYDDSYPFLLTDGVTFYFASNEEDRTLGGYDIFVTKYNINTDEYSDPEQLPMPFNSPYNDYMMAIDEVNHVGWFASDRYQPEGKVCIYIFLYEKTPEFYFPEDRSLRLRQLARLVSIRETWKDGVDYKPVLEKIRNMQPAEKKHQQKMRSLLSLPIVSCTRHCLSSRVRRLATFLSSRRSCVGSYRPMRRNSTG